MASRLKTVRQRVKFLSKKDVYNLDCGSNIEDIDTEDKLVGIVGGTGLFTDTLFIVYVLSLVLVLLIAHIYMDESQ